MKRLVLWNTIYREYYEDRLFDPAACKIGRDLLLPGIHLAEKLEKLGIQVHTYDQAEKFRQVPDLIVCQDIPYDTYECVRNDFLKRLKYYIKRKKRFDIVRRLKNQEQNAILILSEPEIVSGASYNPLFHERFKKIYTWKESLVDNVKYFKYYLPQPVPSAEYRKPFCAKKDLVMIASDKNASAANELYSERKKAICESRKSGLRLDLYGIGWDQKRFSEYCGATDDKLETLSGYKFSVCFENMSGIDGYVTEKIFDCFFADVVPVYYGAPDICQYIPKECFIDFRDFEDYGKLYRYLADMNEARYNRYLDAIHLYLKSENFRSKFSEEAYVEFFANEILEQIEG